MTSTTSPRRLRRGLAAAGIAVLFLGASAGSAGAQEQPTDTTGGCQICHVHKDLPLPRPEPEPEDEPDTGESQPDEPDPRCDPKIESCP
jgi:hypothetical protein